MDYFHLCAGQDTMEQISVLGLAHLGAVLSQYRTY